MKCIMRAIKKISEPVIVRHKKPTIETFLLLIECILRFAPDRMDDLFLQIKKEFSVKFKVNYYDYFEKLQDYLEKNFFNELYADRMEREQIVLRIPSKKLILVHGLIGVGKTVLLGKIEYDDKKLRIIDFKREIETFKRTSKEEFELVLRDFVYHYLREIFISTDEIFKEWIFFIMQYDQSIKYQRFREITEYKTSMILHYNEFSIKSFEDQNSEIRKKFENIYTKDNKIKEEFDYLLAHEKPQLVTLINFIRTRYKFTCLAFDNVDRLYRYQQAEVFTLGVDISNKGNIPIIIALRNPNVEYLKIHLHGDVIYKKQINEFFKSRDNIFNLSDINDRVLSTLFERRIKLITKKENSIFIQKVLEEFQKDYRTFDLEKCKNNFWNIFKTINDTFVDQGIHQRCNYNLRGMLLEYFRFIYNIMLNAERPYRFSILTKLKIGDRRTKIRDYYFKWITCGGKVIPINKYQILNIYDDLFKSDRKLKMLYAKILELLYNWKNIFSEHSTFKNIFDIFSAFQITKEELKHCILKLSKDQEGNEEFGFLSIEKSQNTSIQENDLVEIMPAGKYFLKVLSVSREYCFWTSINTNFNQYIIDDKIEFDETYKDKFKFIIVKNFIKRILFPAFKKEIADLDTILTGREHWSSNNIDNIRSFFTVQNNFYIQRLINSNISSLPYSSLGIDQQNYLREEFVKLSVNVNKFLKNISKK